LGLERQRLSVVLTGRPDAAAILEKALIIWPTRTEPPVAEPSSPRVPVAVVMNRQRHTIPVDLDQESPQFEIAIQCFM
jgi:hypothetical protein